MLETRCNWYGECTTSQVSVVLINTVGEQWRGTDAADPATTVVTLTTTAVPGGWIVPQGGWAAPRALELKKANQHMKTVVGLCIASPVIFLAVSKTVARTSGRQQLTAFQGHLPPLLCYR